jgi:hypothetical protein
MEPAAGPCKAGGERSFLSRTAGSNLGTVLFSIVIFDVVIQRTNCDSEQPRVKREATFECYRDCDTVRCNEERALMMTRDEVLSGMRTVQEISTAILLGANGALEKHGKDPHSDALLAAGFVLAIQEICRSDRSFKTRLVSQLTTR